MNGWLTRSTAPRQPGMPDWAMPGLRRLPMVQDAGVRLLVARRDLPVLRATTDADAPGERALAPGQVRLAVERFVLGSGTLAAVAGGERAPGWRLFPTDEPRWGNVPVWGRAVVIESQADGVRVGRRVFGALPMGTHLVVEPRAVEAAGFDDAAHGRHLPEGASRYAFVDADVLPPLAVVRGSEAVIAAWLRLLDGQAEARRGLVLAL